MNPTFYDKISGNVDEGIKLNSNFKELFEAIESDDEDNIIDAQELANASLDKKIKKLTSKYIVKHSSEWDKVVSSPSYIETMIQSFKEKLGNVEGIDKHLENEKIRVDKLSFFTECSGIEGFPSSDEVYHFNPIGLIGEFKKSDCIPLKEAKEIALKVSGQFEGLSPSYKSLAGNFDGAGMSWGIIQFNFGQDTLGPLLKKMQSKDLTKFNSCFENNEDLTSLNNVLSSTINSQISWAIDMQNNHNERWKTIFNNLAEIPEFQEIQLEGVAVYDNKAIKIIKWMRSQKPDLMTTVNLSTFVALHDLAIQQGNIDSAKTNIINKCNLTDPKTQDEFIRIVVEERGATANSLWRADCISRRIGILNGKATQITHSGKTSKRDNKYFNIIKKGIICGL